MKDRINHPNHELINPTEVEVRLDAIMTKEDIKAGLGQTMHRKNVQDIVKIIEAGEDMILIIEVVTDIVQEVTKGMGDIIMIITIEGVVIEIKITIGTGVGHTKDNRDRRDSRSIHNSRLRSGSRASTNRGRISSVAMHESLG